MLYNFSLFSTSFDNCTSAACT